MSNVYSLFLGDLTYFCTESNLYEEFGKFGKVLNVRVIRGKETMKTLCYGFVEYLEYENARAALNGMNGKLFHGRILK
jgi:RNA recognition motif-containing protein